MTTEAPFVRGRVDYKLWLFGDQEWGYAWVLLKRGPTISLWWPLETWPVQEGVGIW